MSIFVYMLWIGCYGNALGAYDDSGEIVFQEYLRWNYTPTNMDCISPGGRTPCMDIRICKFAASSLAIGGWPTLCGWVGKGVPKVCCGLPLALGSALIATVEAEKAKKRECGTNTYPTQLSDTENRFLRIVNSLPPVDTSDPNKFDPPLDLSSESIMSYNPNKESRQGKFPWMVSIRKNGIHVCGGSLIHRKHILTAAHCVEGNEQEYRVHIGNLYVDDGYAITVTKISIHWIFEMTRNYKGLAILRLHKEILTPMIPQICLPGSGTDDVNFPGKNVTLLKWGNTIRNGERTQKLLIIEDLVTVSAGNCIHGNINEDDQLIPGVATGEYICTEGGQIFHRTTKESGGPLMYRHKTIGSSLYSPWILMGVDTFGPYCKETGVCSLYTRVSDYSDWITKIINEDL